METDYYIEEAQPVCRMCIEEINECYSINDEVADLIFSTTTISVRYFLDN
jgi:hypothetical protein